MRAKLIALLVPPWLRRRKKVEFPFNPADYPIRADPTLPPGSWYLEDRPYSFGMVDWRKKPHTEAEEQRARRILFGDDDPAP